MPSATCFSCCSPGWFASRRAFDLAVDQGCARRMELPNYPGSLRGQDANRRGPRAGPGFGVQRVLAHHPLARSEAGGLEGLQRFAVGRRPELERISRRQEREAPCEPRDASEEALAVCAAIAASTAAPRQED